MGCGVVVSTSDLRPKGQQFELSEGSLSLHSLRQETLPSLCLERGHWLLVPSKIL